MGRIAFSEISGADVRRVLIAGLMALGGCVPGQFHYASDNKRVDQDPERFKQFEIDKAICQGEAAKANLSTGAQAMQVRQSIELVYQGCMAQKGYVVRQ